MLDLLKYNLIFFFSDLILLFFKNTFLIDLESILFNLNNLMLTHGMENISDYLLLKSNENKLYRLFFYHEYIQSNFYKKILYASNLPIFFYFGLLFILTTISSLVLLSYYGFYGIFILNLISIILF
jgi:hypothetical protein